MRRRPDRARTDLMRVLYRHHAPGRLDPALVPLRQADFRWEIAYCRSHIDKITSFR